jgi:hypothetical protein
MLSSIGMGAIFLTSIYLGYRYDIRILTVYDAYASTCSVIALINFRITIRKLFFGLSKVCMYVYMYVCMCVCLSPRLWTHFSTDLDETLEINLEYY